MMQKERKIKSVKDEEKEQPFSQRLKRCGCNVEWL